MTDKLKEDELNALWNDYQKNKTEENRNRIIMAYSDLVTMIGVRMRNVCIGATDVEDIINQGFLALIEAIDRFDNERDVKFETFASIRIKGAMVDYIRKQDIIPRRVRKLSREIEDIVSAFRVDYQREPTDEELAKRLNISVEKLNKYQMEIYNANIFYFDSYISSNTTLVSSVQEAVGDSDKTPESTFISRELSDNLAAAIDTLDYKEKTLISLYYYEGLKLKEIAYVFDLTESRVCQIHLKAITKIKQYLKEKDLLEG